MRERESERGEETLKKKSMRDLYREDGREGAKEKNVVRKRKREREREG